MKKSNYVLITLVVGSMTMFSCSNDDLETADIPNEVVKEQEGRFDNSPFVWDYVYSLNESPDQIYIGDLNVVPSGISGRRGSSSRPSSTSRPSTGIESTEGGEETDNFSVINPTGIYIGGTYPISSFPYKFDKEVTKERNPIDLIFDFSSPYITEVTRKTGSVGYKLGLKNAIASNDYKSHANSVKESVSYSMTAFSSYSDLEKGFSSNAKFGGLFTAQVKLNTSSKKIKVNGQLFARLTSNNFTAYMDTPPNGIFINPVDNTYGRGKDNNVYIRSITYGKVVYVAIESEYQYEKVKFALETSVKFGFGGASAAVNQEVTNIFNKSAITIFAISDDSKESFFVDGMKNMSDLFKAKYTNTMYGFPIFIQGRYVHDNSAYYPSDSSPSSGRETGSGQSTRPSSRP